jgi:predicted nucleic acid-binding protein
MRLSIASPYKTASVSHLNNTPNIAPNTLNAKPDVKFGAVVHSPERLASSLHSDTTLEWYINDENQDLLAAMDVLFKMPEKEAEQYLAKDALLALRQKNRFQPYSETSLRINALLKRWCENALASNHPLVYHAARWQMVDTQVKGMRPAEWMAYMELLLKQDEEKPASARMGVSNPPWNLREPYSRTLEKFVTENRKAHYAEVPQFPYNLKHILTFYFKTLYADSQTYYDNSQTVLWGSEPPKGLAELQEKVFNLTMRSGKPELIKLFSENMQHYFSDAQWLAFAQKFSAPQVTQAE